MSDSTTFNELIAFVNQNPGLPAHLVVEFCNQRHGDYSALADALASGAVVCTIRPGGRNAPGLSLEQSIETEELIDASIPSPSTMTNESTQPMTEADHKLAVRTLEVTADLRRDDIVDACEQAIIHMEQLAAEMRREWVRARERDVDRLVALPSDLVRAAIEVSSTVQSDLSSTTELAIRYTTALHAAETLGGARR